MDFLDVPLVHLLEPMFYQPHPDGREAHVDVLTEAPIAFRSEDIAARQNQISEGHLPEKSDSQQCGYDQRYQVIPC